MHCTCSERNQYLPNDRNLSSSSATLPRQSRENLTGSVKKSALKSSFRTSGTLTPKKSVTTIDVRASPLFSTLPRSRARSRPHVATIFSNNNENNAQPNHRPRRKSEVIPWHQHQQHQQSLQSSQCTCRSSCYFCNLNYPKVQPLSASTNALNYYYPFSTLSLNNPTAHQSQYNLSTTTFNQPQYLPNHHYVQPNNNNQHHHSMINLNHSHTPVPEPIIVEPLATESPAMSDSPVPAPPAPPLNPSCARCRFTSSVAATSNVALHRQPIVVGSNPHLHATLTGQNSQPSYGVPPTASNAYTGELKMKFTLLSCT